MLSGVCVCMANFWGQLTVPIRIRTCLSACSNQYTQVVLYSILCELSIRTRRTYVAYLRIPRFLFAPAAVYLFKFNASSPQFNLPFPPLPSHICLLPCCAFFLFLFLRLQSRNLFCGRLPKIMLQIFTLISFVFFFFLSVGVLPRGCGFVFLIINRQNEYKLMTKSRWNLFEKMRFSLASIC